MSSRRALSEQVVRTFFANPIPTRTLYSPVVVSQQEPFFDLEKLGKLAGLQVQNRDEKFRRSVLEVLDFCTSIGEAKRFTGNNKNKQLTFLVFESDVPFEPPNEEEEEEQAREGGNAEVLLKNAAKSQEGLFVAPPTSTMISKN